MSTERAAERARDTAGGLRGGASAAVPTAFPTWPLAATLGTQTVATMGAYCIPAVAPAVAKHLGVAPELVGLYISTVYGVGIASALLSPGAVYRHGAVRVNQGVLAATLAMLATAATGSLAAVVLSAVLMGLAYGAAAPASTHLLVPRTPPSMMNLVLSLRQVGVPMGGMLAGLLMPPLALSLGWQSALLVEIVPVLLLILALEGVRRGWDVRAAGPAPASAGLLGPLRMLRGNGALARLSFAAFVYSGLQVCFIAFMTTHLTTIAGFDLIGAGRALAVYQLAGVVSRPIWGWIADHFLAARWLLALQGLIMAAAAALAGHFSPAWSTAGVLAVCTVAGATAAGFTGIAYAEYARIGGAKRTEATGLGAASCFSGVMVLPALMSAAVRLGGGYLGAYIGIGLLALTAGAVMAMPLKETPAPDHSH